MGKKHKQKFKIKKLNLSQIKFYKKIISETKEEITNLVKSQKNLIDIRTPSFYEHSSLILQKNNLVELTKRLQNIELIEHLHSRVEYRLYKYEN